MQLCTFGGPLRAFPAGLTRPSEGYGVPFEWPEYEGLAAFARDAQGTVIISVNDHPDMRAVFAGLEMRSVPIAYTVGGSGQPAERHELIIGNWRDGWPKPVPTQAGLFSE